MDVTALKQWGLYVLAPHHYVTTCLGRWAKGTGAPDGCLTKCVMKFVMTSQRQTSGSSQSFVMKLQVVADLLSSFALFVLLGVTQPSSPPAALAIGYWLTTAGWVAAVGGITFAALSRTWSGVDSSGTAIGRSERVCLGLSGAFSGYVCLLGASLMVLAPLQLGGVVRGLNCPNNSYLNPVTWVVCHEHVEY